MKIQLDDSIAELLGWLSDFLDLPPDYAIHKALVQLYSLRPEATEAGFEWEIEG